MPPGKGAYYDFPKSPAVDDMAASIHWEVLIVGAPITRALIFGVYIRAPDFWKLPYKSCMEQRYCCVYKVMQELCRQQYVYLQHGPTILNVHGNAHVH